MRHLKEVRIMMSPLTKRILKHLNMLQKRRWKLLTNINWVKLLIVSQEAMELSMPRRSAQEDLLNLRNLMITKRKKVQLLIRVILLHMCLLNHKIWKVQLHIGVILQHMSHQLKHKICQNSLNKILVNHPFQTLNISDLHSSTLHLGDYRKI